MSHLKAIRNHIVFQFVDEEIKHMGVNQFEESTNWGFKYVRVDESTGRARWITVVSVGHEVPEEIQPGMRVLVDNLKWSPGFEHDFETYWRTDSDHILGVDEETIPAT